MIAILCYDQIYNMLYDQNSLFIYTNKILIYVTNLWSKHCFIDQFYIKIIDQIINIWKIK